ncbi:MAG TPA: 2Fe-2S iron-sulfur cluster-binding protein [Noviherbaspirillum sp.]|nr:2Fe-2S iron-sulfur cluster-binding protein [Noviherbaspirillum sp.]
MSASPARRVRIEPEGFEFDAQESQTLLESARRAGIILPASCRNGTCRTCLCRVASGTIRYAIEWPGVSREEKQEGYVLPCVAHPTSDVVLKVAAARKV